MNKKVLGNMKDLEKRIHHFSTQCSLGFLSIDALPLLREKKKEKEKEGERLSPEL
jgi:hypothetical protein